MFRELCGEKSLKNVVLVTNMWGRVTPQQGVDREQQLMDKYFKAAIEKGAQLCRHYNTLESARAILRRVLKNTPLTLKIQRELIDEGKDIGQTGAGAELNREIREVIAIHQTQIRELEERIQKVTEEGNEETLEELEEEKRWMQEEMEKFRKALGRMGARFERARREMEGRMKARFEEQMKRVQAEHGAVVRKCMERLNELEREGRKNASENAILRDRIADLERASEDKKWGCIVM